MSPLLKGDLMDRWSGIQGVWDGGEAAAGSGGVPFRLVASEQCLDLGIGRSQHSGPVQGLWSHQSHGN